MKRFSTILFLFFVMLDASKAQEIEAIDSIFINSLSNFSKDIETIKDSIWPDMKIGPYCIFRLNGPM